MIIPKDVITLTTICNPTSKGSSFGETREPQERSLCYFMIALASADKLTAIDAACNTATRIANRCFATTKPLTAPTAPPEAGRRTDDSAASAYDSGPPAKRPRGDGARGPTTDENINPDRGADLKRRHKGFMRAMVEKSLHTSASQIFSPAPPLARQRRRWRVAIARDEQIAVRALQPLSPAALVEGRAARPLQVPPAAHRDCARRASRVPSALQSPCRPRRADALCVAAGASCSRKTSTRAGRDKD